MTVCLITPAAPGSTHGNRVTALRWQQILRGLGHRVTISQQWDGRRCDLLVALHARRSAGAAFDYRRTHSDGPLVIALTGTDVYHDIHHDARAREVLELADRLVALQPLAIEELPEHLRSRARVIHQSVSPASGAPKPREDSFDVCVAAHLRAVKDPFRTALAVRLLPGESRVRVLHLGLAMEDGMERRAREEERANRRYRWLGGVSRARTRRVIASSRLLVLTSLMEGGANVISEAIVDQTPVVASRIAGSRGLLGDDYPGYFEAGDTESLAALLWRAETDAKFYSALKRACARRAPLFRPTRERAAWRTLIREFAVRPRR